MVRIILALFITNIAFAQDIKEQERLSNQQMREGNSAYQKEAYADAEVSYKKGIATYPNNPKATYNLANAMSKQKRYKEAIAQYDYLAKTSKSNKMRSQSFHNIGNAYMGLNQYQKAVDAYKNALRINPKDEETRYNLAYAQMLLNQQQKDNKNKNNKDKKNKQNKNDKDKKDKKNKKDDKKDDKKDKKDDEKDNKDKKDDKKDKKDNNKDDKDKKPPQPSPAKLSTQQTKQLLEALQNEEKKTQDKVNAKRVKVKTKKNVKDW